MKVNKFIAIYEIAIADRREDIWEKDVRFVAVRL